MISEIQSGIRLPSRRTLYQLILLASVIALSILALLLPEATGPDDLALELGDVAPQDIIAPAPITYTSEVLTAEMQDRAADAVAPVYAPPDAAIARAQVRDLRATLTYIDTVRADQYATPEQQAADLAAIQFLTFSPESAAQLLLLSDTNWQAVRQEALVVLDQVMRSTIREDRLEEARRSVPALISFSLPEEHAGLVSEIVTAFVSANSLYSESLTETKRQEARQAVSPVTQAFLPNETIILRGRVLSEADIEALDQFGLLQETTSWEDQVSILMIALVSLGFIPFYLQYRKDLLKDTRSLLLISIIFLIFLFGARLIIPNRTVIPYVYPLAGCALLISVLLSAPVGRVIAIPLSILAAYGLSSSFELTFYYMLTSMFGVLLLRNVQRISSFFWAGTAMSISGAAVILAFRLPAQTTDLIGIITLLGATLAYSLSSVSLAILLQFFLAQLLGLTTTLQLIELSRPDHPLLQFILRNAPGTYQHSLQIANLAEQAAELIEADALLTRVGALYHDCGKARQSHYFIENQAPGSTNPHSELPPAESSTVINRHILDGLELAQKYKLPKRIQDFILEHHGTMVRQYQYVQAVEAAGGDAERVDKDAFRYPGPRPQSVETALVMLADGVEARSRAKRPQNEEDIQAIVVETVNSLKDKGQLDDTALTMKDLNTIIDSFTATLKGVYHPRIPYPTLNEDTRPAKDVLAERNP